MLAAFDRFASITRDHAPRTAIVLGSGLGGAIASFRETASVPFDAIPGLAPPSVRGHMGRVAVGHWNDEPILLFGGRLHFYEGHSPELVTRPVQLAAELGVRRLVLTNSAGGIHPALAPGELMVIRGHLNLIGPSAWKDLTSHGAVFQPYFPALLARIPELFAGVYAAFTGSSYETPAEIRALAACGADAVGMSTALEAEAAAELGLEVAAISCITNRAAGMKGATQLDHAEVLANANLATEHLARAIERIVRADSVAVHSGETEWVP
ncbi:MAG TPA: purine-nucleoside phosphorylase [Gemmata sp.]|nr:purine-nucleoside phosphorylase [Gemmata sp.]